MSSRLSLVALAVLLGSASAALARPNVVQPETYDVVFLGDARPVLLRMHIQIDGRPLGAIWEEFVGAVFKDCDRNGDGVLSRDEASRIPMPAVIFNNFGPVGGPSVNFAEVGTNNDGKVSRAELAYYFRTHGAAPFQLRNGDSQSTVGYTVRMAGMPDPATPAAINQRLFDLLDTDKDGKLSAQELAAGPAILRRLDSNDDEMVALEELNPNNLPESDFTSAAFVFTAGAMQMSSSTGPFLTSRPGEPNMELARRLLDQYGRKDKAGPRKKLTRADLNFGAAIFEDLHPDANGSVTLEDLARFGDRSPDLELMVSITHQRGASAGQTAISLLPSKGKAAPLAAAVVRTPDGLLTLNLGVTRLVFGNPQEPSGTFSVAFNQREQYLNQFKQADRDKNGYLDAEEAKQSPFFRNLFSLMDRDGDGKVFEKEVIAYLDQTEKLHAAAMKSCVLLSAAPEGAGLFDLLDTNHDQRLSVRELRQMGKLIAQIDRDGDGKVSKEEIPRSFRLSVRQGVDNRGFQGGTIVVSANGRLASNRPLPEPSAGPVWFRKMDRNRDGDVSRREFLGTDEEFRRIDLDGDGLISPEEADRADQFFRKGKGAKDGKP
jgi:Ca2+-binding EF-hand superfamily protein